MGGPARRLIVCALCAVLAACGSSAGKGANDGDAGPGEPSDAGWYVPDAGPPTSMRVTGGVGGLGPGPRAGGTMQIFDDDFQSNRTCGGTVCVTGAIGP